MVCSYTVRPTKKMSQQVKARSAFSATAVPFVSHPESDNVECNDSITVRVTFADDFQLKTQCHLAHINIHEIFDASCVFIGSVLLKFMT